jgi:AcrR family transcriptional regulator
VSRSDTKKRILDVAAAQFAEYGFNGTSLRNIMREAGVNVAAAHYHFGSKDVVYRAVVDRFVGRISAQRIELLEACNELPAESPELIERIFYALIAPHINLVGEDGGAEYARIIARYASEPRDLILPLYKDVFEPTRQRFLAALRRVAPGLSDNDLDRSYGFTVAFMATSLVDPTCATRPGTTSSQDDLEELIATLVTFAASGFRGLMNKKEESP